jgi:hypothetical protein
MTPMNDAEEERKRAALRGAWPVRRLKLGEESDDLSAVTTATERIAMMWPLAMEAWVMAGLTVPDYTRETMPGRILRGSTR